VALKVFRAETAPTPVCRLLVRQWKEQGNVVRLFHLEMS